MSQLTRELDLNRYSLMHGSHDPNIPNGDFEACAMEMVAYMAGEPWSDSPACTCPVLGEFVRTVNDGWNDEERQALKPFLPRLIGTRANKAIETVRSYLALDWLIRIYTPAWLNLAGLTEHATSISNLSPITSLDVLNDTTEVLQAAWSAADSAARSTAWSAARLAARSAAWSAAWLAARSAADSAAWSAADSAAWSAADSAARLALAPTVERLQVSALDLLDRMIEATA